MDSKLLEVTMSFRDNFSGPAGRAADSVGDKFSRLGQAATAVGGKMTTFVTLPILAAGTALVSLGVDAAETESKIAAVFGDMTTDIQAWAAASTASITQTELAAQDQAATMMNIAEGMGIARDAAFDLATGFTEMGADLSSFHNMNPEEVFVKLRGAISGEFEALKSLGIVLNQDIITQTAYANGVAEVGAELTSAQKATATYIAIQERMGAALGDVERTQDGAANTMRAFKAELGDAANEIGMALVPMLAELLTAMEPVIDKVSEWGTAFSAMDSSQQRTILAVAGIVAAIGPLLLILGQVIAIAPAVGAAVSVMFGPWGLVIAAVVAGVALIIQNWDEVKLAAEMLKESVIAAMQPIIDWFVTNLPLIKATWETILGAIQSYWDTWGETFTTAWSGTWEAIKTFADMIWTSISAIFEAWFTILGGFLTAGMQIITGDWSGAWETIKTTATDVWDIIKNTFSDLWDSLKTLVSDGLQAIKDTFTNMLNGIKNTVSNWAVDVAGSFTELFNDLIWNSIVPDGNAAIAANFKTTFDDIALYMKGILKEIENDVDKTMNKMVKSTVEKSVRGSTGVYENDTDKRRGRPSAPVGQAQTGKRKKGSGGFMAAMDWESLIGSSITNFADGGLSGVAAGALPMIGSMFGPIGSAVGSLLGGLFGKKKKPRGNDPSKPVFVSDINNNNLMTELLNITKSQLGRSGAGGVNAINTMIRAQAGTAGAV